MIELMVILVIIAILLIIGIPSLMGSRARSQDRAAQSDISSAYSVEKIIYSGHAAYTDDPIALRAEEPNLTYIAGDTPVASAAVYVYLASGNIVYVMEQSLSGTCYYLRDSNGAGAGYASSPACNNATAQSYAAAW